MTPRETANDMYLREYNDMPEHTINSDKHICSVKIALMKCSNLLVIYEKDKESENYKHYKEVNEILTSLHSFK